MHKLASQLAGTSLAIALLSTSALVSTTPLAADALSAATIPAAAGEKMGGGPVAARPEGGTITTAVSPDDSGTYYFPPLPSGKYRVWAQALSFETAKGDVDLGANKQQ